VTKACVQATRATQLARRRRFVFQFLELVGGLRDQVTVDPLELTVDAQLSGKRRDPFNGGTMALQRQFRTLLPEAGDQPLKANVQDLGQVRGGPLGFAAADPPRFQHRDLKARFLQKVSGGQASNPPSHDGDVDLDVTVQRGACRWRGLCPEGCLVVGHALPAQPVRQLRRHKQSATAGPVSCSRRDIAFHRVSLTWR